MNLKEKIYLLTYSKPNYFKQISDTIYGEEKKQLIPIIKKLEQDNWIKRVKVNSDIKLDDGRGIGRKYYQANIGPLFDSIYQSLKKRNKTLSKEEKKKLKHFLGAKHFKNFLSNVMKIADLKDSSEGFEIIKIQLSNLCAIHSLFFKHFVAGGDIEFFDDVIDELPKSEKLTGKERSELISILAEHLLEDMVYEKYSEELNDFKEYDTLKKELNILFFPLLDKLADLHSNLTEILNPYLIDLFTKGEWDPYQ